MLSTFYGFIRFDGSVKSPISALCCILHHCGVGQLRLIPQDLHALISNILRNRLNPDFLRDYQVCGLRLFLSPVYRIDMSDFQVRQHLLSKLPKKF